MSRKISQQCKLFKTGDFVFAKMKGYRPWPARVLQPGDRKLNVFFYGTCNMAEVPAHQIFSYATCKLRLGNQQMLRRNEFKRAMMHAEQAVANPAEDHAFYHTLAIVENNYLDAMDMELCEEYILDNNDGNNNDDGTQKTF